MSTFLELCQKVASDSGTVSGTQPTTVVSQTGRLGRIVSWVDQAYTEIQNLQRDWMWLETEFEESLVAAQQSYAGSDFSFTRLDAFLTGTAEKSRLSLYDTTVGVSDEGHLQVLDWQVFHRAFLVGANRSTTGKPTHAALDPAGKLWLYPTPDATYKLHGVYRKSPQTLALDADLPEMPARFHDLIKWQALIYLGEYDESAVQLPLWMFNRTRVLSQLERNQLPEITAPGTLA
jgi:hypothetical protein